MKIQRIKSFYNLIVLKMFLFIVLVLCMTMIPPSVNSLIGYDCSHPLINVTTIALDKVNECHVDQEYHPPVSEQIQLVQLADSYMVHVYQCKVVILRHVTHCGMHSHSSEVLGGVMQYIREMTQSECEDLHRTRTLRLSNGVVVTELQHNSSTTRAVVFGGMISSDARCHGGSYSDLFGSWSEVVVQGTVTVVLTDYTATADTSSDKLVLRSGLTCSTSKGYCMDTEAGYTYWKSDVLQECDIRKHLVLYEGPADKYTVKESNEETTTYMVENQDKIFGLRVTGYYRQCMFKVFKTEHPKLLIIPKTESGFYFVKTTIPSSSLDLMTYINSKFVFVEKVQSKSMAVLYKELSTQRCMIERKTLLNLLSLAVINPPEFAYNYMESPGYTALTLGEVIHISKCIPVETRVRTTAYCYHEIPVSYMNKSMFLTPRSRLLQVHGTQVDCDPIVNSQFLIDDNWYAIGANKYPVPTPHHLAAIPIATWKYNSVQRLADAGIYSYEDSERLRSRIMNPYERSAISNVLVLGASGKDFDRQGITLTNLVDEDMLSTVSEEIAAKVWGWFSIFGNVTSGLLGVYFFLRFIKFAIDTLIHGRALYEIFGFSFALIGSVWDSVTTYLIHRGTRPPSGDKPGLFSQDTTPSKDMENSHELKEIMIKESDPSAPMITNDNPTRTAPMASYYPKLP